MTRLLFIILSLSVLTIFVNNVEAFSIDNHEKITSEGLYFLKEAVQEDIADETEEKVDTLGFAIQSYHIDNCQFSEAFDEINDEYDDALDQIDDEDYEQVADEFGQLLHTVQDFYSHSNWVELEAGGYVSGIFETGVGQWQEKNAFEEYNGALLIEETSSSRSEAWQLLLEESKVVIAVNTSGETLPGLITGEAYVTEGCPPEVSLGHWDHDPDDSEVQLFPDCIELGYLGLPGAFCYDDDEINRIFGTGLNKDTLFRDGFDRAREIAIAQTTHEWCRLVNLVSESGGDTAVVNLFNAWVDPDHMNEAIAACSDLNIDVISKIPELLDLEIIQATDSGNVLDLMFVIDTTGSMADDIEAVKQRALEIINQVGSTGSNWQIGIVTYRDHPQSPYGDPGDYVSKLELPFSANQNTIITAINGITVAGGGDGPEAVFAGLLEAIHQPWRMGARKVIILMGDAPPHDPDPLLGYTSQTVLQAAYDVDPASIFPVLIQSENAVRFPFQVLADGSSGRLFYAADAVEVVPAILSTISVATGVQLSIGLEVQVASLEPAFPLRSSASMQASVIRAVPRSEQATIVDGPQVVFEMSDRNVPQNFNWWKIRTASGDEGWIQETYYGEPILIPSTDTKSIIPVECTLSTIGDVNIRSGPGTEYEQIASRAGAGQVLAANGQLGNIGTPSAHWWQLIEGFWVRNDQVRESGNCAGLPVVSIP